MTLCGPSIGLGEKEFAAIDLVAFLRLDRTFTGYRRRVCAVYAATGTPGATSHQRICRWNEATDSFTVEAVPERWAAATERAAEFLKPRERQAAPALRSCSRAGPPPNRHRYSFGGGGGAESVRTVSGPIDTAWLAIPLVSAALTDA